jgi:hypothetical protein
MRGEERTCLNWRGKPTMAELACDFFTEGAPLGRCLLGGASDDRPSPYERSFSLGGMFGIGR